MTGTLSRMMAALKRGYVDGMLFSEHEEGVLLMHPWSIQLKTLLPVYGQVLLLLPFYPAGTYIFSM